MDKNEIDMQKQWELFIDKFYELMEIADNFPLMAAEFIVSESALYLTDNHYEMLGVIEEGKSIAREESLKRLSEPCVCENCKKEKEEEMEQNDDTKEEDDDNGNKKSGRKLN